MHSSEIVKPQCQYAASCSGCSYWGIPYSTQLNRKADVLRQEWESMGLGPCPEVEIHSIADQGLRDRLDFRWQNGSLGLFDRNRDEVVDLKECLQLSPDLAAWYQEFRQIQWPFRRATLRLRVSAPRENEKQLRGVWFDLANEDVKELLAEEKLLRDLVGRAIVEVGQRRKRLYWDATESRLRLSKEPHFEAWTRTWMNGQPASLFSRIADFSQPGDRINQLLVQVVTRYFDQEDIVMDWGAGSGNLTLPAVPYAQEVWALDHDEMALMGLKSTIKGAGPATNDKTNLQKIHIRTVDFHKVGVYDEVVKEAKDHGARKLTWIIDPPRSGAGALLYEIPDLVTKIISVSCYTESFLQDSFELSRQGFRCESLALVDQFPQTHHGEWVSKWVRSNSNS